MNPQPILCERTDAVAYSQERLLNDLRIAAKAIDAPFDESQTAKILTVFDDEFKRCVVQLKATCKPATGVYYRFFYKWERDLTQLAQEHQLLPPGHSPIIEMQAEVLGHFQGATRAGLDFDTSFGLAKVWTFTGGPQPLDEFLRLSSLPDNVRQHRQFFHEHGLRHVFFVASDFQHDSMNVYFGMEEDCRNERWLRSLVEATGGPPPSSMQYQKMIASLAVSAGIGTTFYWDDRPMGRWALYGLNVPCYQSSERTGLPQLPHRLERFRDQAPTLNASPQFNVAWSFGKAGFYTKLEKSYAKDADYFLTVEMGGNLSHPHVPPQTTLLSQTP